MLRSEMRVAILQKLPLTLTMVALLLTLLPGLIDAATAWRTEGDVTYVPMLILVAIWLFHRQMSGLEFDTETPLLKTGIGMLLLGAIALVFGRSQQLALLELGATIPLLAGVLALLGGRRILNRLRFPLLFLVFLLPFPGWVVDSLTQPLKLWISTSAEWLFYQAGYPVARNGVLISLGQYRLLVADACSGLHSLIFLCALGSLYLHLTPGRPPWQRLILGLSLIPVAVFANLVRVLALMFITYHWGDGYGQSYWHDAAGIVVFVAAFAMIFAFDRLLLRFSMPLALADAGAQPEVGGLTRPLGLVGRIVLGFFLMLITPLAALMTPDQFRSTTSPIVLEELIPRQIGEWTLYEQADQWLVSPDLAASVDRLYNQTLNQTYVSPNGERIMLSIAYGGHQLGNALQAHRPEYCYRAQGFTLFDLTETSISLPGQQLAVRRLIARQAGRNEPVTYWMTVGDEPVLPGFRRKLGQLQHSLRGVIPDGMLVRVSSIDANSERAFAAQTRFIQALQGALPGALGFYSAVTR